MGRALRCGEEVAQAVAVRCDGGDEGGGAA